VLSQLEEGERRSQLPLREPSAPTALLQITGDPWSQFEFLQPSSTPTLSSSSPPPPSAKAMVIENIDDADVQEIEEILEQERLNK
jgi:hypothetical protein